jgi:hypothetical protein
MPRKEPIDMTLNSDRGKSVTIIGGVSTAWPDMKYIVTDKTNVICFKLFLNHIGQFVDKTAPEKTVLVLDNHSAHKSKNLLGLQKKHNLEFLFLPPSASELNPVERKYLIAAY